MIDGLIAGKLYGTAQQRTAQSGKTFVTAKVRAAIGSDEALFVNVIAFDETAKAALLALGEGDGVALAGAITPKVWTDRNGEARPALDMVAHGVLSAYHVKRKREAMHGGNTAARGTAHTPMNGMEQARQMYGGGEDMNDEL